MNLAICLLSFTLFTVLAYRPGGWYWRFKAHNKRALAEMVQMRLEHRALVTQQFIDAGLPAPTKEELDALYR